MRSHPVLSVRHQYAVGIRLACAAAMLVPTMARAHFILVAPESWMSQTTLGLPEKLGPCGNEGGGTPTGAVTTFHPGDTVAITIDEVVMHPGHYRVALALHDRSELPPEPAITPVAGDPCGSVAIEDPAIPPILADNILPHSLPFDGPQTFTVALPADVTCEKCTLQVLEFMSDHSVPCFYHHCADISIEPEAAPATPTASETPDGPDITPTPTETPAANPPMCGGDCDGNQSVTVDELVTCVRIALGELAIDACPAIDPERQGRTTIDRLIAAVNDALNGCPVQQ